MRLLWIACACMGLLLPHMASAMSLSEAKAQGLVGEQADGYLGAVKPGAEEVIATVNLARKAEYEKIAGQNKQDISVVEKLAAQKAYEMTPADYYVRVANGAWQKK